LIQCTIRNLFDDNTLKNHRTLFSLSDEESIAKMWSFCVDTLPFTDKQIEPIISNAYFLQNIINKNSNPSFQTYLAFEYARDFIYINITDSFICDILEKNQKILNNLDYKIKEDSFSARFDIRDEDNETYNSSTVLTKEDLLACEITQKVIYNFIDKHTLLTMTELNDEMHSELIHIENRGFSYTSLNRLINIIKEFSNEIGHYHEFRTIHDTLSNLSFLMKENADSLIVNEYYFIPIFNGITKDLEIWQSTIFEDGTDNIHFLDDSMEANVKTLANLISSKEYPNTDEENLSVDDIFF